MTRTHVINAQARPRFPALVAFRAWVVGVLVMDALVIALAAISIWNSRVNAENEAFIDAQNTSRLLSQNLIATFDRCDVALMLLKDAAEQSDIRGDATAVEATAIRLFQLHPELQYLRMADAKGDVISGNGVAGADTINIATRDYFVQPRDNPNAGLVFSKPIVGYASGKWSIVLARRVNTASSEFAGVVFAVITLDWIQNQFAAVNLGSKGAVSLRALDLSTVARYPAPETAGLQPGSGIATEEWREKLAQNPHSGTYTAVSPDGFRRSLAYVRVGSYPFFVIVGLWPGDYLDQWRRDTLVTVLLAAIIVVVSALIAHAWYRREEDSHRILTLQEQALQQSRQHLDVAVESAGVGFWIADPLTGEMEASDRARSLYGLSSDTPIDHARAIAAVCTDDRGRVQTAFQSSMQHGEPLDVRFRVCHADGSIHWLLSRGQWLPRRGIDGQMIGVLQDITPEVEHGEELRSARIQTERTARSLAAAELKLTELTQNLEARVQDEVAARESAQSRLAHAEQIQAVGRLAGGVAHEFNNLLTVITGTIDTLEQGVADRPQLAGIATMIAAAAERGAKLTANLLAFASKQPLHPENIDIQELLIGTCNVLRSILGRQVDIDLISRANIGMAFVDPDQLRSAIINLGTNARDAMPADGTLTIEMETALLDEAQASARDVAAGRYIVISVSDTGTGIPDDIRQKIFEPFFTTKDVGKGTGLGLSMVFGFVKQSGGHIEFSSQEGKGTSFRIYLPSITMPDKTTLSSPESTAVDLPRGSETVLCVEDDPNVRRLVTLQLQTLGYSPLVARNPAEAMAFIADESRVIDLLFTDIILPGRVNGWELAEAARRLRPDLKALYTSGYSESGADGLPAGRAALLLKKPYRLTQLASMLRSAIES